MKRTNNKLISDPIIDASSDLADTLEEVSAVTRYREEARLARELRVKLAKARQKAVYHGRD
jgi:hypothetical protein